MKLHWSPILLALTACASGRVGEPLAGPLELGTDELRLGQRVYFAKCHQCHPNGEGGLGPDLNGKPAPRLAIRTQVRAGAGAMPAFDRQKISDQELDALAEYMLALRRHAK